MTGEAANLGINDGFIRCGNNYLSFILHAQGLCTTYIIVPKSSDGSLLPYDLQVFEGANDFFHNQPIIDSTFISVRWLAEQIHQSLDFGSQKMKRFPLSF